MKTRLSSILWACVLLVVILSSCDKINIKPKAKFTEDSYGCIDFLTYKYNEDFTEILKVSGDKASLNLQFTPKSFDLSDLNDNLEAFIEVYDSSAFQLYCNDVVTPDPVLCSEWEAFEGTASISILQDSIYQNPDGNYSYMLRLLLENTRFRNSNGKIVKLETTLLDSVYVGWLPG